MSTPKQIAATRLNAQRPAGPRSAQGKAAARASSLKTELYARSQVIALEPPPEAKANLLQSQSAQQKNGFVPSFCPTPDPIARSPCRPRSKAPSHRCWNPSGGSAAEAPETSNSTPRLFSATGATRNGLAEFTRPGRLGSPSRVFPKNLMPQLHHTASGPVEICAKVRDSQGYS